MIAGHPTGNHPLGTPLFDILVKVCVSLRLSILFFLLKRTQGNLSSYSKRRSTPGEVSVNRRERQDNNVLKTRRSTRHTPDSDTHVTGTLECSIPVYPGQACHWLMFSGAWGALRKPFPVVGIDRWRTGFTQQYPRAQGLMSLPFALYPFDCPVYAELKEKRIVVYSMMTVECWYYCSALTRPILGKQKF